MQEINLYLPELRPSREWLTANTVALVFIGFTCLLVIVYVLHSNSNRSLAEQVVLLENQEVIARERIEKVKKTAKAKDSNQLEVKISTLRRAIQSRAYVKRIISSQSMGNTEGFVDPLVALARQSSGQVSLQRIRLSDGGEFIEMLGVSRTPSEVPSYLHRLQNESALAATSFGHISIAQSEDNKQLHDFALGFESVYDISSSENTE